MGQVKRIDFEKGILIGKSGKEYNITQDITIGRWNTYEEAELELYYGRTGHDLFIAHKKIHDLLNASKVTDAGIENANTMYGVAKLTDKKKNAGIRLALLFINQKDEDLSTFDDAVFDAKFNDLSEYSVADFFLFATQLVPKFKNDLQEILKQSTEKIEATKKSSKSTSATG
jgi:hypothetical protein